MIINILWFIVVIQQTACSHYSNYKTSTYPLLENINNEFNKQKLDSRLPLDVDTTMPFVDKPLRESPFRLVMNWPKMRQEDGSLDLLHRNMPSDYLQSTRRKRRNNLSLEKLNDLINNYSPNPDTPKIIQDENNEKRTHIFGFWTNYLARN